MFKIGDLVRIKREVNTHFGGKRGIVVVGNGGDPEHFVRLVIFATGDELSYAPHELVNLGPSGLTEIGVAAVVKTVQSL